MCDATCLERNLNLVLQTLEITDRVVVCLNLMDEAEKKKIKIDQAALSEELSVPVIGCSARSRRGIDRVQRSIRELCESRVRKLPLRVRYDPRIERALAEIERALPERKESVPSSRFFALKLLEGELSEIPGQKAGSTLEKTVQTAWETLREEGLSEEAVHDEIVRGKMCIRDRGGRSETWLRHLLRARRSEGLALETAPAAAVSSAMTGLSSAGNSYREAIEQGYLPEEARQYAVMSGLSEFGTTYLLSGISKFGGKLTGSAAKAASERVTNCLLYTSPSVVK